jgi:hypothetical protein
MTNESRPDTFETAPTRLSAGVVPYCISDSQRVYVILGRERYSKRWYTSKRWSSFAGAALAGESAVEAAEREFREESMCLLQEASSEEKSTGPALPEEDIRIDMTFKMSSGQNNTHTSILRRVEWCPHMCEKFQYYRKVLRELRRLQKRSLFALGEIGRHGLASRLPLPGKPFLDRKDCIDVEKVHVVCRGDAFLVVDVTTLGGETQTRVFCFNQNIMSGVGHYVDFLDTLRHTEKYIRSIGEVKDHPALTVHRSGVGNFLSVSVSEVFLEKEEIRLWSVDELRSALSSYGFTRHGSMRLYFMPLLASVLDVLETSSNTVCMQKKDGPCTELRISTFDRKARGHDRCGSGS